MNFFRKILLVLFVGFLFFGCINLDVDGDDNNNNGGTVDNGGVDDDGDSNVNSSITIGNGTTGIVGGDGENDDDDDNSVIDIPYTYDPESSLGVYFIDVATGNKQGEAILFKKGQYEMLIDSGPVESAQTVINFLDGKVEGNLEVLVLTHDDDEHWGGSEEVINNFNVKEVWWNGQSTSGTYNELIEKIEERGITLKEVVKMD